jgi:hypothetical protein
MKMYTSTYHQRLLGSVGRASFYCHILLYGYTHTYRIYTYISVCLLSTATCSCMDMYCAAGICASYAYLLYITYRHSKQLHTEGKLSSYMYTGIRSYIHPKYLHLSSYIQTYSEAELVSYSDRVFLSAVFLLVCCIFEEAWDCFQIPAQDFDQNSVQTYMVHIYDTYQERCA